MFYLSRQRYWHDQEGRDCIELVTNVDAISPGCIEIYGGWDDPRECALEAIQIQEAHPDWPITIANLMVYGDPDDALTVEEVNEWAERHYANLAKCDECGEVIGKESYSHEYADGEKFCREYCAEENYNRIAQELTEDEDGI